MRFKNREVPGIIGDLPGGSKLPVEDVVTLKLELEQAIKNLPLDQQDNGFNYTCGGPLERSGLLAVPGRMAPAGQE